MSRATRGVGASEPSPICPRCGRREMPASGRGVNVETESASGPRNRRELVPESRDLARRRTERKRSAEPEITSVSMEKNGLGFPELLRLLAGLWGLEDRRRCAVIALTAGGHDPRREVPAIAAVVRGDHAEVMAEPKPGP